MSRFSGEGGESTESLAGEGVPSGGASFPRVIRLMSDMWVGFGSASASYE